MRDLQEISFLAAMTLFLCGLIVALVAGIAVGCVGLPVVVIFWGYSAFIDPPGPPDPCVEGDVFTQMSLFVELDTVEICDGRTPEILDDVQDGFLHVRCRCPLNEMELPRPDVPRFDRKLDIEISR